jgi:DNA polymerase III subunit alpha
MGFAHLHCYTYATPEDGWLPPGDLCDLGCAPDVYAMAITDRGTLWKAPEFVQAAVELDVEPIIGCELRVVTQYRGAKAVQPLVLLVENDRGYGNLVKLVSAAQSGHNANSPLPLALLGRHADGLIALSGGQQGLIPRLVRDNRQGEAVGTIAALAAPFGLGRFFVELQHTGSPQLDSVNVTLAQMAHTLGHEAVATVELRSWTKYALGMEVTRGTESGTGTWSEGYHLIGAVTDMLAHMSAFPSAISNTVKVADMCHFGFPAAAERRPRLSRPSEGGSLGSAVRSGLSQRLENPPPSSMIASPRNPPTTGQYLASLDQELKAIRQAGLEETLITMQAVVHNGRQKGAIFAPGSGASGSLALFALGISDLDPLLWDLPNTIVERGEFPGRIDFSLASSGITQQESRRLLRHIQQPNSVVGVSHARYPDRQTLLATRARATGVRQALVNELLHLWRFDIATKRQMEPLLGYFKNADHTEEVRNLYRAFRSVVEELDDAHPVQAVDSLDFLVMHQDSRSRIPTMVDAKGNRFTQYEGGHLREMGYPVVKWSVHPVLESLQSAALPKRQPGSTPSAGTTSLPQVPLNDPAVFEYLANGGELHHLLTTERKDRVEELRPDSIEQLAAVVALDRRSKACREHFSRYVANARNPDWQENCPRILHDQLATTFGVPIYREQIEAALVEIASFKRHTRELFPNPTPPSPQSPTVGIRDLCGALGAKGPNEPWSNVILAHPRSEMRAAEALIKAIKIDPAARSTCLSEAIVLYWSAWLKVSGD